MMKYFLMSLVLIFVLTSCQKDAYLNKYEGVYQCCSTCKVFTVSRFSNKKKSKYSEYEYNIQINDQHGFVDESGYFFMDYSYNGHFSGDSIYLIEQTGWHAPFESFKRYNCPKK